MRSIDDPWEMDTHYFIHSQYNVELDAILNGNKCKLFVKDDRSGLDLAINIADYFMNGCMEVKYHSVSCSFRRRGHIRMWFNNGYLNRNDCPALSITSVNFLYKSIYYIDRGIIASNYVDDDGIYFKTMDLDKTMSITKEEFEEHYNKV